MSAEADAPEKETPEPEAEPQPLVSPAQFPPPKVELTFPAAVIQFQEAEYNGEKTVVMTTVAPDPDGIVVTRHYPMSIKYAGTLEQSLHEARGVSDLIVAGADQLPPAPAT